VCNLASFAELGAIRPQSVDLGIEKAGRGGSHIVAHNQPRRLPSPQHLHTGLHVS
jgi:hypothetical protein